VGFQEKFILLLMVVELVRDDVVHRFDATHAITLFDLGTIA